MIPKYFFRAFKSKAMQDHISMIVDDKGDTLVNKNEIAKCLLSFFGSIISAFEYHAVDCFDKQQQILSIVNPILDL